VMLDSKKTEPASRRTFGAVTEQKLSGTEESRNQPRERRPRTERNTSGDRALLA
jgi:hypothetical protein